LDTRFVDGYSQVVSDLDRIFEQPRPGFLDLLETDPDAALQQFVKYARPWLMEHPTPGMVGLTPREQRDVIRETVNRCKQNGGEALRNYTDLWGTFGEWLSGVAENTCAAKFDTVPAARVATTSPPPQPEKARRRPAREERPSRAVHAFVRWFRTPWVFLPVLVVVAIAFVLGVKNGRQPPARYVDGSLPVSAVLIDPAGAQNSSFDTLPVTLMAEGGSAGKRPDETTIFRESPAVLLRLDRAKENDKITPARILFLNEAGETVWQSAIDPAVVEGQSFFLQVEPRTFPPDDYKIHIVDANDRLISQSAIMFR
jgi:hypothetical protein